MNARIEELILQTPLRYNQHQSVSERREELEKFADLLIKECANESRLAVERAFEYGITNTIPEYVERKVCEHFGVEK